jgi:hypothetical protein
MTTLSRIFFIALAIALVSLAWSAYAQESVVVWPEPGDESRAQPARPRPEELKTRAVPGLGFTQDPKEPPARTAPVPSRAVLGGNAVEVDANGEVTINGQPCPTCRR